MTSPLIATKKFVWSEILAESRIRGVAGSTDQAVVDAAVEFGKGKREPTAAAIVFLLRKLPDAHRILEVEMSRYFEMVDTPANRKVVLEALKLEVTDSDNLNLNSVRILAEILTSDVKKRSDGRTMLEDFGASELPGIISKTERLHTILPQKLMLLTLAAKAELSVNTQIKVLLDLVSGQLKPASVVSQKGIDSLMMGELPELLIKAGPNDKAWVELGINFLGALLVNSALQNHEAVSTNPKYLRLAEAFKEHASFVQKLAVLGSPAAIELVEKKQDWVSVVKAEFLEQVRSCEMRRAHSDTRQRVRTGEIKVLGDFLMAINGRPAWQEFALKCAGDLIKSDLFVFFTKEQQARIATINPKVAQAVEVLRDGELFAQALGLGKSARLARTKLEAAQSALGIEGVLTNVGRCHDALQSGINRASDHSPKITGLKLISLFRSIGGSDAQLARIAGLLFNYSKSNSLTLKALFLGANKRERQIIREATIKVQAASDSSAPFSRAPFRPPLPGAMPLARLLCWLM